MRANNAYQDGNSYKYHKGIRAQEEAKSQPKKTKLELDFERVLAFFARLMNPGHPGN